jgi:DNA helicase-2/ATP-dependent DNA helicase PcrA
MDPAQELSDPQRVAVLHGDGPLLVLAGAGSGKTRVITHRVAHLVAARGIRPWRILAVTFTNKAAGEMRERVSRLLGPDAGAAWIGTFHATCARLLRRHGERVGLGPGFTIYDDDDTLALIGRILRERGIEGQAMTPRAVQGRIDRAKQDGLDPDGLTGQGWIRRTTAEVYREYQARIEAAGAADFGDLLVKCVRLLEREEALREELRGRFEHLLVDEFQDTNRIQLDLVRLLTNDRRNLCVVGDDDQSIYRWRGAEVRNILEFERHFPGATVVRLEENYRSVGNVLAAAGAVVGRIASRHEKTLFTRNPAGDPVRVVRAGDEREEASAVAREAARLRREGTPLAEMAVFYRVNAQSRVLEEAVRGQGLPYVVIGGFRFYERHEVKNVLAYLRLVLNPADDVSFARIVNVPARGIGKVSFERLAAFARGRGIALGAAATLADEVPDMPAAARRALRELAGRLDEWRRGGVEGPLALAERILDESGYRGALLADATDEGRSRLQNVQELLGSIREYAREDASPTLAGYLENVALQSPVDELAAGTDRLALMTVHAAKGLEFDAVFVVGLEEGVFPYRPFDRGEREEDEREHQDEERRLCYVAMTRARKRLWLLYARCRSLFGGTKMNAPSRYLDELPDVGVERTDLPGVRGEGGLRPAGPRGFAAPPARSPGPARATGRRDDDEIPPEDMRQVWEAIAEDSGAEIRVGDRVRHVKYGVGTVSGIEQGRDLKLLVEFPSWGKKKIVGRFLERA